MQRGNTLEQLPLSAEGQKTAIAEARRSLGTIILGKDHEIALALACLLARGHLLIEDLPGLGKTILAQALARVLGLSYQRIQFTSDLLPADIVGVSVFRQQSGEFAFQPGPVFAQLVLADEVNRATPKAQSALLEAMEERQVSVDGRTHALPQPFFVVATQNPSDQVGTFPLPESQLDRFLMRLELGYPNEENERALLTGADRRKMLPTIIAALNPQLLEQLQDEAHTRESPEVETGLSPRGALALVAAAKAHAFIEHHPGVFPDDVQAVFPAVAGHRLKPASGSTFRSPSELTRHILETVTIP
jgi:MoxR-like ATPase